MMTQRSKMGLMLFVLIGAVCLQGDVVFSQQQPSGFESQIQYWTNPSSWAPYYAAAANVWQDYVKKSQQATNQLYQQWDKTGAGNMFAAGMDYAQKAAKEVEKNAAAAAQKAQQTMGQIPFF